MGSTSKHGRATINPSAPEALGICDRCGFLYNLRSLRYQWDYAGSGMVNRQLRVCNRCYDTPNEQLRTIILPPDPMPVRGARIEPFDVDEHNEYTLKAPIGASSMFGGVSDLSVEIRADFLIPASIDGVSDLAAGMRADFRIPTSIDGVSDLAAVLTQSTDGVEREATDNFEVSGASPFTEVAASIGSADAGRLVFVTISGIKNLDDTITSMTVGGVSATAATQVRRGSSDLFAFSEIWWAAVPTGTTGNIVITATGDSFTACSAQVYKVTNADTVTPIANSDTGDVASGNVTTDVTIGNLEASIATAFLGGSSASATTTFTNVTEDSEFSINIGAFANSGHASRQDTSGLGAITFTASVSSDDLEANKTMAAVVITTP